MSGMKKWTIYKIGSGKISGIGSSLGIGMKVHTSNGIGTLLKGYCTTYNYTFILSYKHFIGNWICIIWAKVSKSFRADDKILHLNEIMYKH